MRTVTLVTLMVLTTVIVIAVELTIIASWMYAAAREENWITIAIIELMMVYLIGSFAVRGRRKDKREKCLT